MEEAAAFKFSLLPQKEKKEALEIQDMIRKYCASSIGKTANKQAFKKVFAKNNLL